MLVHAMARRMNVVATMVLTFLVGAGFLAVGIGVMVATAKAVLEPAKHPDLEIQADKGYTHRAA